MLKEDRDFLEEINKSIIERSKNLPKDSPYYTQRQWDRVVGYGKVPENRKYPKKKD